ncbi:MAG TPA: alanine racemase [Pyrinomonadaceae bacterium]|nr:alanine racemase [Pyrinomonadaceae bacterium]
MSETEEVLEGRRPTWAAVDLDALASNYRAVCGRVGGGVRVMGVVKADAYGHGAAECARRLEAEGAGWFAVASPEEGFALRRGGVAGRVLSFGGFWEGQAAACLRENVTPVVYRPDMAEAFDRAARDAGVVANVHVKIDTGMGRLGVRFAEAGEFAERLLSLKNVRVEGVMTHFAAADEPGRDCFTGEQLGRFRDAVALFRERGHRPVLEHASNSAAALAHPEASGNMVRPGGVLYGLWRDVLPPLAGPPALRPVMSLRTRVTLLKWVMPGETLGYGCTFEAERETLVATLPVGYHDGYARALSNRGRVIVRGRFAPVVGRVSMDLTMVDVTDVPGVELGDVVTLFGSDGELSLPAEELARTAGTISYEITCGVSARVPRVYES